MLNLIHLRNERRYGWYGVALAPLLALVRARVLWLGRHEAALRGSPPAEKLMIIRYRSHRRFLAMVANPYYLLANLIRQSAVEAFELSFTYAHLEDGRLSDHDVIVGINYNPPGSELAHDAVASVLGAGPGRVVYASEETSPMDLLGGVLKPSDPNPLTYKRLALVAYDSADEAGRDLGDRMSDLESMVGQPSVHVYRRRPLKQELPWARRGQ